MFGVAAGEARRLRQNSVGPAHFLLAVLAEPGIASEAMAEVGMTHQRVFGQLAMWAKADARRVRYVESKGFTTNPAAHDVSGWANGHAAARGRQQPTREDWLLAVLYDDTGLVGSLLQELGTSAPAAVEALRRRGVKTPEHDPAEHRPWRGVHEVEVVRSEWRRVLDALTEQHPPGSGPRWGFTSGRHRSGNVRFVAEEPIDLDAIVREALAGRSNSEPPG